MSVAERPPGFGALPFIKGCLLLLTPQLVTAGIRQGKVVEAPSGNAGTGAGYLDGGSCGCIRRPGRLTPPRRPADARGNAPSGLFAALECVETVKRY